MNVVRVAVWNVEWAGPGTKRGREISRILEEAHPDVVCITEGYEGLLPEDGHWVESDADYGYPLKAGRRKVILWSRTPWANVDDAGNTGLPGGRYVEGVTTTRIGAIRIVGVCIPWREAHVRTGRRDRRPWEDHRKYLASLRPILDRNTPGHPEIVLGDFNQRIPRSRVPKEVFRELKKVFDGKYTISTAGELAGAKSLAIDHVAHTQALRRENVRVIPAETEDGLRLSDHLGLVVDLRTNPGSHG